MADRTSRAAPPPPGAPRRAVRRNLFQGLTRRATGTTTTGTTGQPMASTAGAGSVSTTAAAAAAAAAATMGGVGPGGSSSTGAAGHGNGNGHVGGGETLRLEVDVLSDGGPPSAMGPAEIVVRDEHGEIEIGDLPTLVFDEADEAAAMDDREESKKERQRLAEAVKQHQVNHTAVREQPEELLEAVKASLRAKVSALADDNWMFEAEPELPRGF
ncbi:hypothetical protein CaCOL14_004138 [Colletotrichum acutatum]|uniref:Uncharacterized protein n=1 Tax=Glomerella acutata TaxID=27357 RepID=A0AAD8XMQ4_GLOAC|nr:uncharacterized protein BDZ83DRAFT_400792 [Colletotrichum acutatum]KAK1730292.1 hypothetical protein BDZ83DRAFT_400792 [Colletotrichum acutatum]